MTKSSLRKDQEKTVTTNLVIGWNDNTTIASGVTETGAAIYQVPTKAESEFQRMLWTYQLNGDPGDNEVAYGIMKHFPGDGSVDLDLAGMARASLLFAKQSWRSLTAVGVVNVSTTKEVDMKKMLLSRRTNKQFVLQYSIVPVYFSNTAQTLGQGGTLWVKETLFQDIFKDDLDEWAGYTFEESAS